MNYRPSLRSLRSAPIGYRKNGSPIWLVAGASPDDDSNVEEDDASTEDPEGEGGEGGDGEGRDPQAKIKALEDEKDRHFRKRSEAEKRADELQKKLKQYEDADKGELEKATSQIEELKTSNSELQEQLKRARLENAFLADNTFEWHNPKRALSLVDLSDVEIDEDGKVQGLKKALEDLAKSDSYLVKPKDQEGSTPPPSGDPANGRTKKGTNADRDRLLAKYPGLRR